MPEKGLVQVYTGDGKGKTTAALGLALRASGHGLRTAFIQFLKGDTSGEHEFVARHKPFEIVRVGRGSVFGRTVEELETEAKQTLALAGDYMASGRYDLIVLDEIFAAASRGFITSDEILALIEAKPESLELVLTGRHAPEAVIERADLVTEMRAVKHPFGRGIGARAGIEY